jgi:hypothetical protein
MLDFFRAMELQLRITDPKFLCMRSFREDTAECMALMSVASIVSC